MGEALAATFNPQLAVVSHAPAAVAIEAACTRSARACITSYRTEETTVASLRRLVADARKASPAPAA